jgi:hypothetical protein
MVALTVIIYLAGVLKVLYGARPAQP